MTTIIIEQEHESLNIESFDKIEDVSKVILSETMEREQPKKCCKLSEDVHATCKCCVYSWSFCLSGLEYICSGLSCLCIGCSDSALECNKCLHCVDCKKK